MRPKLVVFDLDGVIFEPQNSWYELHRLWGTEEEGKALTERYLKIDFDRLVKEVVGRLWKGKPAEPYYELIRKAKYTLGAKETVQYLKEQNVTIAIISSAPLGLVKRAKDELGMDFGIGNDLIIKDHKVTGEFKAAHDFFGKGGTLKSVCELFHISPEDTAVVGDNENDIPMMQEAGLSIAFCPESEDVAEIADVVIRDKDLRKVLDHMDFPKTI